MAPSNTDWVEFSEWVILFILAVGWSGLSFFSRAASILFEDSAEEVAKKNKEKRLSTLLSKVAWACLLLGIAIFLIWTEQADTTKTQNGGQLVKLQYWRWIGITAFLLFMSWAYSNYTHMFQEDWLHLEITILLAGAGGTLSIFAHNHSRLQIGALVFTGFFFLMALVNAARFTNIKSISFGFNWVVWFFIYLATPLTDYILLILGPEETRVLTEGSDAIGYIVVALFTAIIPGVIMAGSFMATQPLAISIETYSMWTSTRKAYEMAKNPEITSNVEVPRAVFDLFDNPESNIKTKKKRSRKSR